MKKFLRFLAQKVALVIGQHLNMRPMSSVERLGNNPLTEKPIGEKQDYVSLFNECKKTKSKNLNKLEAKYGFSIDENWLNDLAFHTQIVKKKSKLNYQHGRLLYCLLMHRITQIHPKSKNITVFETGTARGFSAICMAKALIDGECAGQILSIDILPHNKPMYWNCVDDFEGKKTRRQLLEEWAFLLDRITFLQMTSDEAIDRVGVSRIHFAFLDAVHDYNSVIKEFNFVQSAQNIDDIIVFDDVSETFPEVLKAVKEIEKQNKYSFTFIESGHERGYAIATRVKH